MSRYWVKHQDEADRTGESLRRFTPICAGRRTHEVAEDKTRREERPAAATQEQLDDVWRVVVLNDPVNLMSYVVMVFRKVLGFDEMTARRHMLEVHEQGRSIVWSGLREQAEAYVFTLQQWHLTAVIEADEAR